MRKRYWIPAAAVALAAIGFFGIGPGYIEADMNRIDGKELIKVSPEAEALHKSLMIVDLHSDTLMWKRDLTRPAGRGHEDLPRLQAGNVALQVFASTTKSPKGQNYDANGSDSDSITMLAVAQLQPRRTWSSLLERSLFHAEKLDAAVTAADGQLLKVSDEASFDRLLVEPIPLPRLNEALLETALPLRPPPALHRALRETLDEAVLVGREAAVQAMALRLVEGIEGDAAAVAAAAIALAEACAEAGFPAAERAARNLAAEPARPYCRRALASAMGAARVAARAERLRREANGPI